MLGIVKTVYTYVINHHGFRRYLSNTSWILAEQFLRLAAGLFVGIYVARYLGPESFGAFNYAIALAALFGAIAKLGLDGIMVRELVEHSDQRKQVLGTAFWMLFCSSVLCIGFITLALPIFDEGGITNLYVAIVSLGLIFQSFTVIEQDFQANVQARYVALCKILSLVISSAIKLYLVFRQADLLAFVIVTVLDQAILAFFLVYAGWKKRIPIFYTTFDFKRSKQLLESSWPFILTSFGATLFMKIDQVMIGNMLGEREVGIYSAAVRIYEAWVLIPYVITVSLLPAIIKSKSLGNAQYHRRLTWLFRLIFWLSAAGAVLFYTASHTLISYTFGSSFIESAPVLQLMMLTSMFAALGYGSTRYFIAEKMEKKIAARWIVAAVLNVVLNMFLIPLMGINGAAVSSLICMFVVNYLVDWLDPDLRTLLEIKHRAIFFGKR